VKKTVAVLSLLCVSFSSYAIRIRPMLTIRNYTEQPIVVHSGSGCLKNNKATIKSKQALLNIQLYCIVQDGSGLFITTGKGKKRKTIVYYPFKEDSGNYSLFTKYDLCAWNIGTLNINIKSNKGVLTVNGFNNDFFKKLKDKYVKEETERINTMQMQPWK